MVYFVSDFNSDLLTQMSNAITGIADMHDVLLAIYVPSPLHLLSDPETTVEWNDEFDRYCAVVEDQLAAAGISVPCVYLPSDADGYRIEQVPLRKSVLITPESLTASGDAE